MEIPVVFSTNDKYAPYLGVALYSLIKHASPKHLYHIYIFSVRLSSYHMQRILSMSNEHVRIEMMDVSDQISCDIPVSGHLTCEAVFRLLIDRAVSQYDKVLYLDCDIVVCRDVAELYVEDINGQVFGAVRGAISVVLKKYLDKLKISCRNFFNTGVLLINISEFHSREIGRKGLDMLHKKRYLLMDQDVLNLLCKDQVKFLDGRWNVEWQHEIEDMYVDDIRKDKWKDATDPFIVHYASSVKPWTHPEYPLADYFWSEARETAFYEEILHQGIRDGIRSRGLFYRFVFPWRLVDPGCWIILYGGGVVGQVFFEQMLKTQYCRVLAVCDRAPQTVPIDMVPVIPPEDLSLWCDERCKAVVIAIEQESVADDIRQDLICLGIPADKIKWAAPNRKREGKASC